MIRSEAFLVDISIHNRDINRGSYTSDHFKSSVTLINFNKNMKLSQVEDRELSGSVVECLTRD